MFNLQFHFDFTRQGDILFFKATGFTSHSKIVEVVEAVAKEIKAMDAKGLPYKILFDLRGLKALDPRAVEAIKELDKIVYDSTAIKVGTVLDSIIAKLQHARVATAYPMENARFFGDYNECITWLNNR